MTEAVLSARICDYVNERGRWGEPFESDVPGLWVYASQSPTALDCYIYEAVLCLVLQGAKETFLGERKLSYGAGSSLIVSHDIHVHARVTEASAEKPYVALVMTLDIDVLRHLHGQMEDAANGQQEAISFQVDDIDAPTMDAMARYFALTGDPDEAKVLAPLIKQEIHYRLLTAPHGGMLRNLLRRNSHASRISQAIERIRQNIANSFTVGELASAVGMSASSFHEHFKAITETTPIQYQKDLRLLEARRLLLEGEHSVSTAAYEVGYESPTQFSREYSRKFGVPPRQDLSGAAVAV